MMYAISSVFLDGTSGLLYLQTGADDAVDGMPIVMFPLLACQV